METLAVMTPVRKFTGCLFPIAFLLLPMWTGVFCASFALCLSIQMSVLSLKSWGTPASSLDKRLASSGEEELKSRMCLSNLCDYSHNHSFSSLSNLIPPLRFFQAILAVLLSIPSLQWEGCHEQLANSMVLKRGEIVLAAFRSRAGFHWCADCDSDDFLMLNCQVVGGILATLLFIFYFYYYYYFKFLALLQTGMYQGKIKDVKK